MHIEIALCSPVSNIDLVIVDIYVVFFQLALLPLNFLLPRVLTNERLVHYMAGDKLVGEVSRLVVAEACIQALDREFTEGQIYELNSVKVIVETYDT